MSKCPIEGCDYEASSDTDFYNHQHAVHPQPETDPDWDGHCEVCGQAPIVPITGMCGPCTFGESETAAGNW